MSPEPRHWGSKGAPTKDFDPANVQMNFWKQKGIYILYDSSASPLYVGQAGMAKKKNSFGNGCIGERICSHNTGEYRHVWTLFSWFGLLQLDQDLYPLNKASNEDRMRPKWRFKAHADHRIELNLLLASLEAVLIEGIVPRFNSRGGDLPGANLVHQYVR